MEGSDGLDGLRWTGRIGDGPRRMAMRADEWLVGTAEISQRGRRRICLGELRRSSGPGRAQDRRWTGAGQRKPGAEAA